MYGYGLSFFRGSDPDRGPVFSEPEGWIRIQVNSARIRNHTFPETGLKQEFRLRIRLKKI